jgi:hypothetical protein
MMDGGVPDQYAHETSHHLLHQTGAEMTLEQGRPAVRSSIGPASRPVTIRPERRPRPERNGLMSKTTLEWQQEIDKRRDDLVALRRDFHRHPELSFEERRTGEIIAERLHAA